MSETWTGFRSAPLALPPLYAVLVAAAVGGDPGRLAEPAVLVPALVGLVLLVAVPLRAAFHRRITLGPDALTVHRTFGTHAFPLGEIAFLQENLPGGLGPQWPKLLVRDASGRTCRTWSLGRDHERIVRTVRTAVIRAGGPDPMAYVDEENAAR
ncbi:hypothetical protein DZF91_12225 [Actinomadura logoneensis]|uniref:PH domain-containing protein n=1 Tax=Actinomadura logoneensis TaxID=2293572 RepID=A0A372JN01_9ACTN|nr:hypothetical protein [Actinomadura logoneensis]RFU41392.1 hypothetical protein DZF91_12225 [Actinomadura logoneensis]